MYSLMPNRAKTTKPIKLKELILRGFGGGLNVIEDDISMRPTDQCVLDNLRRTASGSQKVRYGSNWFDDVADVVAGDIVDQVYFANSIISVTDEGEIAATDDDGVSIVIWNDAIAALLPGAPTGWSNGLDSINFVNFRNKLLIHNGIDKPISIDANLDVTYLVDAGTGSNTNVPIGTYGCVAANYHCIAGIPGFPTTIYISSVGTDGTFPGDPIPNDSISIDVGAYAPEGAESIRGIAGFRSNLMVFFQGQTLVVKLGVYNAADEHTPEFPDSMPDFGLLGHRCVVQVENDLLFAGLDGLTSAKRNVFGNLDSDPLSAKVEPLYQGSMGNFTDEQLLKNAFVIYDKLSRDLIISLPDGSAFVHSFHTKLKYAVWSTYANLGITCACTSKLGRVFYAIGTRIYQHGNGTFTNEKFQADRLNDRDASWAQTTVYSVGDLIHDDVEDSSWTCTVQHLSGAVSFAQDRADQILSPKWEEYLGEAISFVMELPWLDSQEPMQVKQNKFVAIGTKGTGEFTLTIYVDNLYKDEAGIVQYDPAVQMNFIGNDAPGFGYDAGPYGGGRRSDDPRLYGLPFKFKTAKPIFTGSIRKPLEFINLKFLYARGSFQR